jgi:hypothetical protein
MGSGAYSVFIDQQVPGGGPTALRRVVPLPPPELSGGVKFTTVVLSLAYDNFGGGWRASDNPCHGEGAEGQWASPDAQRKHRSWAQILSLYACG